MCPDVLRFGAVDRGDLQNLLAPWGLQLETVIDETDIPGSYWGDEEAGLIGDRLYLRADTPLHSALHEACHYICMSDDRRTGLHTDAGGGYDEENGVCYLQILLSEYLAGMGKDRMLQDMDAWGYSFRFGSARAWFERDAADARQWLIDHGVLDDHGRLTHRLRER
jgi:hypothetical protein